MNARTEEDAMADVITPVGDFPEGGSRVVQLRIPPHSTEAEMSVLGGLLLDPRAWDRVGDLLAEGDFYRYQHRLVFTSISRLVLANREADVITVWTDLEALGKGEEAGGLAYLNSLAQYVPSAGNIRRYAEIVREKALLRQLITASDENCTAAFNPQGQTIEGILESAQQRVLAISQAANAAKDDWGEPDDEMVAFLNDLQARADGQVDFVATGLAALDEKLDGGAREGEVIVIAARPSQGKTALALTINDNIAEQGHPTAVMSMEMGRAQVRNRRVSMHSGVPLHKIKRPERMSDFDWSQMTRAVETIRKLPVRVSDQGGLTLNQVRTKARGLKRRYGLRSLVIDYIGLMEGSGGDPRANRATQLGAISRGLKALAKELGITIFLLAQLNREVEKRPNMRPIMADLRECGDIEQDADVILFVHRPFFYKPDLGIEWKPYAEVIVGKQRDGEAGATLVLMYDGPTVKFHNWPKDREIPTSQVRVKGGGKEL